MTLYSNEMWHECPGCHMMMNLVGIEENTKSHPCYVLRIYKYECACQTKLQLAVKLPKGEK